MLTIDYRFTVTFDPPTGPYTDSITEYNVIFYDFDTPCSYLGGAAFTGSPAQLHGLVPGHRYLVAPTTYNAAGGGFPEIVNSVIVGGGTPAVPSNLQIIANDPTTVHVTWDQPQDAGGYRLVIQNISDTSNNGSGTVGTNCADDYFLFPGTWNYQFAVSALNGNLESTLSGFVPAPHPQDGAAPVTCPPSPPFCPVGGATGTGADGGSSSENPGGTSGGSGGSGSSNGDSSVFTQTQNGPDGNPTAYTETLGAYFPPR